MAIKQRKQITGTTDQIKSFAGHEGVLAFDKTTKHLHVLSGTAGKTTELANKSDIPAPQDISGKADKTYVDQQLATKEAKGTAYSKVESDSRYATLEGLQKYQITVNNVPAMSNAFRKSIDEGRLSEYTLTEPGGDTAMVLLGADEGNAKTILNNILAGEHFGEPYYVRATENRGVLKGYEQTQNITTDFLDKSTADSSMSGSNLIVREGGDTDAFTKSVFCTGGTVNLGPNWKWVGGKAPELKFPGVLVCHWNGGSGIVNFIPWE